MFTKESIVASNADFPSLKKRKILMKNWQLFQTTSSAKWKAKFHAVR